MCECILCLLFRSQRCSIVLSRPQCRFLGWWVNNECVIPQVGNLPLLPGSPHGWKKFFSLLLNSFRKVLIYENVCAFQGFGSAEDLQFVLITQKLDDDGPGGGWKKLPSPVGPLQLNFVSICSFSDSSFFTLSSESDRFSLTDSLMQSMIILFHLD